MAHVNQNQILGLFYHELSAEEERRAREHLAGCGSCRAYLATLNRLEGRLSQWPDEQPHPETFDRILAGLPREKPVTVQTTAVSAEPLFRIVAAMAFIMCLIYFIQDQMTMLPVWQQIQEFWWVQGLGSFGLVAVGFLGIGTFITLALAPVLYFDLHRRPLRL